MTNGAATAGVSKWIMCRECTFLLHSEL
jgi:hypothetical protein